MSYHFFKRCANAWDALINTEVPSKVVKAPPELPEEPCITQLRDWCCDNHRCVPMSKRPIRGLISLTTMEQLTEYESLIKHYQIIRKNAIEQAKTTRQLHKATGYESPAKIKKHKEQEAKELRMRQLEVHGVEYCKTFGCRAPQNANEMMVLISCVERWIRAGKPQQGKILMPNYHIRAINTNTQTSTTNMSVSTPHKQYSGSSGYSVYWQSNQQALYAFFANYLAALYVVRNNGGCNNEEYVNWITHLVLEPRKYRDDYVNFSDKEFNKLDTASQRVLSSRITETKRSFEGSNGYRQYAAECVRVLGLRLEINVTRMHLANRILAGANGNDIRNDLYEFLNMSDANSPLIGEI